MKFYANFAINAENCLGNRAINYGDGLFETMLLTQHGIPLWEFHQKRLNESLQKLGLRKIANSDLYKKILSLASCNSQQVVKLVVFRKDNKRSYASNSQDVNFYFSINELIQAPTGDGLTLSPITLSRQKFMAGLKHLNRLEQVLAANALSSSDYDDAVMVDNKGLIIETISKNMVLIKNNMLYTPKLNQCGVYGVALRWLQAQGYKLKWKKIEFKSLAKYDVLMVCNSVRGFHAIANIDNTFQFQQNLPVINEIQQKWHKSLNL